MKFEYNPRILEQLGTELITSDEVAFTELLKNSYDAKASNVRVHFLNSIHKLDISKLLVSLPKEILNEIISINNGNNLIIVEDNGNGMNYERLKDGFFTVGSDLKEKLKKAEESLGKEEKMTLGDKGLGRLSSQRLAGIMLVETCSKEEKHINYVTIEWAKFFKNLAEEAKEQKVKKLDQEAYTRLWFIGNVVDFNKFIDNRQPVQIDIFKQESAPEIYLKEKLQSSVSFLYSPFEELNEAFQIQFFHNNHEVKTLFHNESINIAETIHSFELVKEKGKSLVNFSLVLKPWYLQMIHLRILGKNTFMERGRDPKYYASLLDKYKDRFKDNLTKSYSLNKYLIERKGNYEPAFIAALEDIMPINGKVYSYHREQFRLKISVDSAKENGEIPKDSNITSIKDFLNYHNGIKLYRDKFRIANLGNKDNDWLNLQQARTKGQQFFRFELGNVLGFVKINDFYQNYIKEISSRQELKESLHADALKHFLQLAFNNEFYQLSTNAYYLVRDILDEEGLIPKNTPKELKQQVDESEAKLKETLKSLSLFKESFNEIKENITLDNPDKIKKVQKVISELEGQDTSLAQSISSSISTLQTAKDTLTVIEERQRESYNNYKLMANGLITEVMTHELHSILINTKSGTDYNTHIDALKSYLLEVKQIGLYKDNLKPIGERMDFLHTRIRELDLFYNFLEKTFIRQGTHDDFENENLESLMSGFSKRLEQRLKDLKTELVYKDLNEYSWFVPKGTLTHVFYNLIDNSLYWISERQKRAAYDQKFKSESKDSIIIKKIDDNTIIYYDSGVGIIDEMQYTLFHPFKSGKKNGRGMGLYIVKNLLESFGGGIQLLPDLNEYGNRYMFSITINADEQE